MKALWITLGCIAIVLALTFVAQAQEEAPAIPCVTLDRATEMLLEGGSSAPIVITDASLDAFIPEWTAFFIARQGTKIVYGFVNHQGCVSLLHEMADAIPLGVFRQLVPSGVPAPEPPMPRPMLREEAPELRG